MTKKKAKKKATPAVHLDLRERLSPHFTLGELLNTSHREIDNTPEPEIIERLRRLCVEFLEPCRERFGPIYVSSGFRCEKLNKSIGGAKSSAHLYGCAADFVAMAPAVTTTKLVRWIAHESGLPFDQVIDEHTRTSSWVHLGMLRPDHEEESRGEALTMQSWADPRYTLFG